MSQKTESIAQEPSENLQQPKPEQSKRKRRSPWKPVGTDMIVNTRTGELRWSDGSLPGRHF